MDGETLFDYTKIKDVTFNNLNSLYSSDGMRDTKAINFMLEHVSHRISREEKESILKPITEEKIW